MIQADIGDIRHWVTTRLSLIHRNVVLLDLVKRSSLRVQPNLQAYGGDRESDGTCTNINNASQAQVTVDITKVTCEQLAMQQLPWNSGDVMLWLNGYYHGERHNTNVEAEAIKRSEDKLSQYCLVHGEMTVMDAVKQIIGPDK